MPPLNALMLNKFINDIRRCVCRDPGRRHFVSHVSQFDLMPAGKSLLHSNHVIIITGFCVPSKQIGETDGPPGALVLGRSLSLLGKRVTIVSDSYSMPLLEAGSRALDFECSLISIPAGKPQADRSIIGLLESNCPDHLIAIERPGKASDGHSYSMRGELLDHLIPQLDLFFTHSLAKKTTTIAIGDGGNEMGMGNAYPQIKQHVPLGKLIGCITPSDHLIPAGVSNWAAYGLAGVLSVLSGLHTLPPTDSERKVLEAMVAAGAVDGCTKHAEATVDGLSQEAYMHAINSIHKTVTEIISGL